MVLAHKGALTLAIPMGDADSEAAGAMAAL